MKNIELANVCYKYISNFITIDKFIEELEKIKYKRNETKEAKKLIEDLKQISKTIKNKEDDFVKNQKHNIKKILDSFDKMPEDAMDEKVKRTVDSLKKDYNKEMDSYERFIAGYNAVIKSKIFDETMDNLDEYEMLEFIGQFIQSPNPPKLTQKEFDELVKVGIEKDERELLWRLAFNYEHSKLSFDKIVKYYIKKKDGYYLGELISAIGDKLDIDKIIDDIDDKKLIEDLKGRKGVICCNVSDEQFNKLISKLD